MIKNRESAARSRGRKQAYTVELESLVTRLEEERELLLREEVEQSKERYKQLMENQNRNRRSIEIEKEVRLLGFGFLIFGSLNWVCVKMGH